MTGTTLKIVVLVLLVFTFLQSIAQTPVFRNGVPPATTVKVIKIPEQQSDKSAYSQMIKSVDVILLETTDKGIIKEVSDIIRQNGKIYILDGSVYDLFVFSNIGKFLYRLNKQGFGIEEYVDLRDFEVDETGNVYALTSNSIVVYDSLGKFKQRVTFALPPDFKIYPTQFAFDGQDGFYLYSGSFGVEEKTKDQYTIYHIDKNGRFTGRVYFPLLNFIVGENRFYKLDYNHQTYTMAPIVGNDTVYQFSANKVHPAYLIDFGARKLTFDVTQKFNNQNELAYFFLHDKQVVFTHSIIEGSNFIHFIFDAENNGWATFVSKRTGMVKYFPLYQDSGVLAILPKILFCNNGTFGGHFSAPDLIASQKSGSLRKAYGHLANFTAIEKLVIALNQDDNPAIMLISIEDF
ncbi:MAG: 6-bladed beta-propeller [Chryseolinea sp.]